MREKTELRLQETEYNKKFMESKEKYYEEKLKKFNDTIDGDPETEVAFDYDGDAMRNTTFDTRVKLNSLKAGMGRTSKKLKEGCSRLNAPEVFNVEVQKKMKEK